MKILMINVSCGTGSTGRICTDLAESLEALGNEVRIAYGRDRVEERFNKYAVKIGSALEVLDHASYARMFDLSGLRSRKGTQDLIVWIKEFNPDVIHLHNIHGYYINIPLLFSFLRTFDKPIIWTLHDCWAFTGHAAFCDSADCIKWKTGCEKCPLLKEYPKAIIDRSKSNWNWKKKVFSGLQNLTLVTPSDWLAGLVKESFLSDYPIKVIHNGIDTTAFNPLKNDFRFQYDLLDKKVIISEANSMEDIKKLLDIVKTAKKHESEWAIVLEGLTKDQIKELPIGIVGLEKMNSPKEIDNLYKSANAFLNILNSESDSAALARAKAYGIPVVNYPKVSEDSKTREKENKDRVLLELSQSLYIDKINDTSSSVMEEMKGMDEYGKSRSSGFFENRKLYGLENKYVILGVASVWDNRKGLNTFMKLAEELNEEKYQIILIGLSDSQIKKLPRSIKGIRRTNSVKELSVYYSMADVFVNPTIEDNYPTTNLEAACCKTPVITYRTGGSPESVVPSQVVEKGDFYALKQMIVNNHLAIANNECFDKLTMLKQYEYIYRKSQTV